ncbi:12-oxophytodienoate reductase, partial [Rhizobiaceae sp. 2RAB30]
DYTVRLADTPDQLAEVLEPLVDAGVSILHASTRRFWEPAFPDDSDLTLAGWTKKITGQSVIMVGGAGLDRPGLNEAMPASLAVLEKPLSREEFDLLAVGRALLADPRWPIKVRVGDLAACRPYTKSLLETLD